MNEPLVADVDPDVRHLAVESEKQQVTGRQVTALDADVSGAGVVNKGRRARRYIELLDLGEGVENFLGNSLAEETLVLLRAHVGEGQDGHGGHPGIALLTVPHILFAANALPGNIVDPRNYDDQREAAMAAARVWPEERRYAVRLARPTADEDPQ